MRTKWLSCLLAVFVVVVPGTAVGESSATIVFSTGQQMVLPSGYAEISTRIRLSDLKAPGNQFLEMIIDGNTFLINVAEVVAVCRGACPGVISTPAEKKAAPS